MTGVERRVAALRGEGVEKVYADGTRALRGLSLEIPAGCFFGLLGPNGSGKSTPIGMVAGLVRAIVHRFRAHATLGSPGRLHRGAELMALAATA